MHKSGGRAYLEVVAFIWLASCVISSGAYMGMPQLVQWCGSCPWGSRCINGVDSKPACAREWLSRVAVRAFM